MTTSTDTDADPVPTHQVIARDRHGDHFVSDHYSEDDAQHEADVRNDKPVNGTLYVVQDI